MSNIHCSSLELLPHDVVELILERLPVESLLRFKSVSKTWKSTMASKRFQERQLIHRRQSRGPDVLFLTNLEEEAQILLGSSIVFTVSLPIKYFPIVCHGSCDGLVCLSDLVTASMVVNPATRWHRSLPLSSLQQLITESYEKGDYSIVLSRTKLGFGKDRLRGTYKLVWLYNSSDFGLDNATTCEVFDFSTNAWRYIKPASPYQIITNIRPVYLDGSLHWLTECKETKVLSFDLHTETFKVISKVPFAHVRNPRSVIMCILDNCLCVSENNWPNQVIWSFDSCGNKTWTRICSIDLTKIFSSYGGSKYDIFPIAIMEKNKLLLENRISMLRLVMLVHDLDTKSFDVVYTSKDLGYSVCYFQSLFTALPN